MVDSTVPNLYELIQVAPDCSFEELRAAYRRRAREVHPDLAGVQGQESMAQVNEAWRILSDPDQRRLYDQNLQTNSHPTSWARTPTHHTPVRDQPAPETQLWRRKGWTASVQGQILRIANLAGRSATQTLLIRNPRAARTEYEIVVKALVNGLCQETESRMRAARAAGAAPLDLAVAATLIGIRTLADKLRRDATLQVTTELLMAAELLDRMWDVLAHELPSPLTAALGGNPQVARLISAGQPS